MTYTPPLNGGRINATISGNTAGAGALVSTGTVTLAGGNNITLSQAGNAITISGGAGGGAGSNTLGMSNLGNSLGTSGVISGSALQYAFAGGNNVTLSQSLNASSGTVTISAANQSAQTQNLHNVTLSGNTAGAMAQVSSGTMTLAGGNNITLSQNANAVTISGPTQSAQTQSNVQAIYDGANSISTGTVRFSNSNGVSFGINGQTLTASHNGLTVQSNQTMGLYGVSNTTQSSSATADARSLSFAGAGIASVGATNNSVVISVPSGGGAGFTAGMSNLGNTSGTSVMATNQLVLAGGDNVTLSQSTDGGGNTVTISAAAGGGDSHTLDYYQNMDRGTSAALGTAHRTLMLQRLNQENDVFAGDITANTLLLNMSGNITATSLSSSHSFTLSLGIYEDQATRLTLVNSASTTWGFTAATQNTAYYHGMRWLSLASSQWSASPAFSQGKDYVFGLLISSSNYGPPISWVGQNYMVSAQRSGTIGVTTATNTSMMQGNFWNAMLSATTTALPASIASNSVNRNNATAIFMPHVILNNRYSGTV